MKTRTEVIAYCKTFAHVVEEYPFHDDNWTLMRHQRNKKTFAFIYERQGVIWINVKCDREWRDFWRSAFTSVVPAYHMNKEHWNSIILDGTVPESDVERMIEESYDLTRPKRKSNFGIKLRKYQSTDLDELIKLFYYTVHSVNRKDYSQEQADVWAPKKLDLENWNRTLLENHSIIAMMGKQIVGFGDIDKTNYLNRLYVHKDFQGRGIGEAICNELEKQAEGNKILVHASVTAKPFFEKRGYRIVKEQQIERSGIFLTNYVMEK